MATFEVQVEGMTGLSIDGSSSPTLNELTQHLKDGVLEVTDRCMLMKPDNAFMFQAVTAEQTSQGVNLGGANVISVVRESGTDNDWRDCRYIPPSLQGRVVDIDSLAYASKYNPVYTVFEDGKVSVFPTPGADPDAFKVYYVNNAPLDASGNALTYADDSLKSFPDTKVYLVVLYASIKSLENALAEYGITDLVIPALPTIGTFSDVTESLPTWSSPSLVIIPAPSDTDIDFSSVPSAPAFITPNFAAPTLGTIGDLILPSPPPVPATFAANSVDIASLTAPVYKGPAVAPDFAKVTEYIETEEDSELAGSQLQKIQAQISEFQTNMSNELNKFNESNVEYQALIQDAMKDVDLQETSDNRELQRFQADITKYQAEVNAKIQEWQQEEWTQNFQKYTSDYQYLLQEYTNEVQAEQASVQINLQVYQQEITKATATYTAETGYDLSKYQAEVSSAIQKFTNDLQLESQRHQSEIAQYSTELSKITETNNRTLQKFSAELQKYTSEMQALLNKFNTELQDKQTTYKWMTERLMLLKNQYDTAFSIQQPRQEEGE